jgi:hypothetical protein
MRPIFPHPKINKEINNHPYPISPYIDFINGIHHSQGHFPHYLKNLGQNKGKKGSKVIAKFGGEANCWNCTITKNM